MTKTKICNLALIEARETVISGDVDTSPSRQAEDCRLHFEQVHRRTLKRSRPAFAQKRSDLALDSTDPEFDWNFAYLLPADFLEVVRFNGELVTPATPRYELEGQTLLTNEGAARLVYIYPELDTSRWDNEYIQAFIYALGTKLASTLRGDIKRAEELEALARDALSEASAASAQSRKRTNSRDIILTNSRWTTVNRRRGTNDTTE